MSNGESKAGAETPQLDISQLCKQIHQSLSDPYEAHPLCPRLVRAMTFTRRTRHLRLSSAVLMIKS